VEFNSLSFGGINFFLDGVLISIRTSILLIFFGISLLAHRYLEFVGLLKGRILFLSSAMVAFFVVISAALHELGHALTAHKLAGADIEIVTFNFVGAFVYMKPSAPEMDILPAVAVSVAGLLINAWIWIFARLLALLLPGTSFYSILRCTASLNAVLVFLNILPLPFMDGHKLLLNLLRLVINEENAGLCGLFISVALTVEIVWKRKSFFGWIRRTFEYAKVSSL
jgi:Zn-dependent protease